VIVPDLTILKAATPDPPIPGAPVSYTLTVSNILSAPTKGTVTVTDALPADFDLAPAITASGTGWTCGVVTRLLTCTRADRLDVGAAYPPITITATLNAGSAGQIINTGIVGGGGEVNTTNNTSTVDNSPSPYADVGVVKVALADRVLVGEQVTFVLAVANAGPSTAANVTLADAVPAGLRILSDAPGTDRDCTVTGQSIACSVGTTGPVGRDLAPGAGVRISVTAIAEAPTGGQTLTNTATVATTTTDVNPANNTDDASVEIVPVANVVTTKTIAPDDPIAGGPIAYMIAVANSGPNVATNVSIVDAEMPAAVSLTGYQVTEGAATCTITGRRTVCTAPQVAVGQRVAVTLNGTISRDGAGADLSNQVSALPEQRVLLPTGTVAVASEIAQPRADLSIRKSMPAVVIPGRRATIAFVVSNAGPSPAENVMVLDRLPVGLTAVVNGKTTENATPIVATGANCAVRSRVVACSLGKLDAGARKVARIRVRVTRTGTFENTAVVGATTTDPNRANNRSTARTTTVTARKTANRRTVRGGQRVTFTITVRNRGTRTLSRLRVCDLLPPHLDRVSAPGAKGLRRPCWTTTLSAGQGRRFSIVAQAVNVARRVRAINRLVINGHPTANRSIVLLPPRPRITG
jgi:uncharacterized repeat protein (TIGR01451 family)